jgi:sterol desaturase/sphingolipid hydroxylase (fatty acid hydroxylase superfamily)
MSRTVAAVLFAVCSWWRPDVFAGLFILGAIFIAAERIWPLRPQTVIRRGTADDVVHFVLNEVLSGALVAGLVYGFAPALESVAPNLDVHLGPTTRFALAMVLAELSGYWGHRVMHQVPVLWKLHALHHSSPTMDWLAPNRRHVLDTVFAEALTVLPLLALGLSPPEVVPLFVVRRAQGLFIHANVRWTFPGLRWLIVTPAFHHWHHSADEADYDKNFAAQWPVMDVIFGTLHFPKHQWPVAYGLSRDADEVPSGYIRRLLWPMSLVEHRVLPGRVIAVVAAVAIGGSGIAYAGTIEPEVGPWHLSCGAVATATDSAAAIGVVSVDPTGIAITTDQGRDETTVRDIELSETGGLSFRVVRDGGVPLSAWIAPAMSSSVQRRVIFVGPEGEFVGTCQDVAP